ncbi:Dimethylaniline monooxygenase [N-oxide-forming]-like protein [Hapsidospora chrysogenum ATCC 11550]|uniref:Dimethylaniline monooxygenase [N-oxide-forming]-like protein n=1 Tax=Hapsidospora chrysogenum (strain ATCC 11550 / CBS 779.69 / DSM 880 / IAM 14645 / JCM 23072 / IMI 49137) TaxID=857340 RepID=A0A086TFU5_HAPC1|nr:Dimethylaniline monooxygenase [N-oxide-forming]-like protein [Hapsidospora chrysogenum ATCC 11550]
MRVAVIGGGPSGLVQLKVLLSAHKHFPLDEPIEVKLFESYDEIGGVFLHHVYEDAELVSSKFLTSFSDFRPLPEDADFFSSERYREYLNQYATHFNLWPHIHLSTRVTGVRRGDASEHVVSYQGTDGKEVEWECDAVAVCSGVHSKANIPDIPGIENVPTVLHSQDLKKREQFGKDTTVMVLGSGETGCDMCYLAVTSPTKRVVFCHRDGWIGAPKRTPGQRFLPWLFGSKAPDYPQLPVDVSQITLFDSMYVHPMVRDSMIIWDYYHFVALTAGCWLCGGSKHGVDQWVGQVYGDRFHSSRLFWNKAWQRVSNYVSTPWRPTKWPLGTRIRRFFFKTEIPPPARTVETAPFPSHISSDGVAHFPLNNRPESELINQTVVKPDVVIFATGYVPHFPFLNTQHNAGRRPYPTSHDADVRQIWSSSDPTVGFIGFIRPGFGAIPPLAELQSMLFTMNLLNRVPNPLSTDDEWHYRMIHPPSNRITYGVEHDSYAYQLAKDIGGAASITDVLRLALRTRRGWRLPYVWAGGASFNTKFRMVGPWRFDGAPEILTGELWETIRRREGLFGNVPLSILPMMYLGSVNLYYCVYSAFWGALAKTGLCKPLVPRNAVKEMFEELARREQQMKLQQGAADTKATPAEMV